MVRFDEFNQPPAPDLGGNDVLPEVLFTTTAEKMKKDLYNGKDIPPDTLIDPDGRIAAYSKRRKQK
ncbi:unnamed protein product [Gongylonema pulchrum]|uniref:Lipoprotein n=1 Tax=Gongylonema pulchrum TaxID=637853 RepID=A0A183ENU0_9BILA|nr:unnamed protein product [Gongylonema pulchrum]